MKVLFVNTETDGHNLYYQKLLNASGCEKTVVFPRVVTDEMEDAVIVPRPATWRKFSLYYSWLRCIREVADAEKPDIIHFVYGDRFYRHFGIGFGMFRKYKKVLTLHTMRYSRLHAISIRRICSHMDAVVVHTDKLLEKLREIGVGNGFHIEYPSATRLTEFDRGEAKERLDLPADKPLIVAIGGTRKYKGLDLLCAALSEVGEPFHLLVAGAPSDFSKEDILAMTASLGDRVTLILRYITDEEMSLAISAADIVAVPYRREFDGASGPLADAVAMRRRVIGPDHGSLGDIISRYHLGRTFESENVRALADAIDAELREGGEWDSTAEKYRLMLEPETFSRAYGALYSEIAGKE